MKRIKGEINEIMNKMDSAQRDIFDAYEIKESHEEGPPEVQNERFEGSLAA